MSEANLNPVTYRPAGSFFPVIIAGDNTRKRGYCGMNPYCLAFVYTPDGNFLVKGDSDDVRNVIDERWKRCLIKYTFWDRTPPENFRGYWRYKGEKVPYRGCRSSLWSANPFHVIPIPYRGEDYVGYRDQLWRGHENNHDRWVITADFQPANSFYYRKIPKRWLPEWDAMCQKYESHIQRMNP